MKTANDFKEGSEERIEFDDAFTDAFPEEDGFYFNPYEEGTPAWHGHEAGVRAK